MILMHQAKNLKTHKWPRWLLDGSLGTITMARPHYPFAVCLFDACLILLKYYAAMLILLLLLCNLMCPNIIHLRDPCLESPSWCLSPKLLLQQADLELQLLLLTWDITT